MSTPESVKEFHATVPVGSIHPTELHYYEWRPADAGERVRGVVHLAHGMVEHLGRYREFAQFLASAGYAVVGADHRGHGLSASRGAGLGYFGAGVSWEEVAHDLHDVRQYVKRRFPRVPYVLFGHSMGSFLVRTYLMHSAEGVAGAAIIGTGDWPGALGHAGLAAARALSAVRPAAPGKLLNALAFGPYEKPFEGRTHFDWLSRNEQNVQDYIADPLSGYLASNSFFVQLLRGIHMVNSGDAAFALPPKLPLYFASGELDPVGGVAAVPQIADRYRAGGSRDVTVNIYPDDRHEIFNETDRAQVWADFAAWLERVAR